MWPAYITIVDQLVIIFLNNKKPLTIHLDVFLIKMIFLTFVLDKIVNEQASDLSILSKHILLQRYTVINVFVAWWASDNQATII